MREIVRNVRMRLVKRASRRVVTVTFLGHGRTDHGDARIGEPGNELRPRIACKDRFPQRTDYTSRRALARFCQQRVEAVLRRQWLDGAWRLERNAAYSPPRVGAQDGVGINRLMRPVEGAKAKVQDTDRHARRVVGWPRDVACDRRQRGQRQARRNGLRHAAGAPSHAKRVAWDSHNATRSAARPA